MLNYVVPILIVEADVPWRVRKHSILSSTVHAQASKFKAQVNWESKAASSRNSSNLTTQISTLLLRETCKRPTSKEAMNVDSMKTDDSPAQTASVGDRVMMTYMKLPMPNIDGAGASGPGSNDSDDARFLDGLFDRLSGSSDNGSDKDTAEKGGSGSNSPQTSRNVVNSAAGPIVTGTVTNNTAPGNLPATLLPTPLMDPLNSQLPSTGTGTRTDQTQGQASSGVPFFTSTPISQSQVEAQAQTQASVQLPQHFMYQQHQAQQQTEGNTGTSFVAVNMNLNQHQHQHQQQVQPVAAAQTTGPIPTPVASATVPNTLQQMEMSPWMQAQNTASTINIHGSNAASVSGHGQVQRQESTVSSLTSSSAGATSISISNAQSIARLPPDGQMIHAQIPQLPLPNQKQVQPPIFADVPTSSSTISTSTASSKNKQSTTTKPAPTRGRKPRTKSSSLKRQFASISDDEEDMEKRRRERNMREQERSQKISTQIAELKGLLASSNVSFKPDKYSTLVSVYDYIQTLQQRSALLDAEQRKIVDTITKSNDLVAKSELGHRAVPKSSNASSSSDYHDPLGRAVIGGPDGAGGEKDEDADLLAHVRGVDYKNIFARIRIGLCVTSIDGRLLACNDEFVSTCRISREILVSSGMRPPQEGNEGEISKAGKNPLSLFNLMGREDMQRVFEAMSTMLRGVQVQAQKQNQQSSTQQKRHPTNNNNSISGNNSTQKDSSSLKSDHWHCIISKCHNSTSKVRKECH